MNKTRAHNRNQQRERQALKIRPEQQGLVVASHGNKRHTVLVTAAFCMYNRYLDSYATWSSCYAGIYEKIGEKPATRAYLAYVMEKYEQQRSVNWKFNAFIARI